MNFGKALKEIIDSSICTEPNYGKLLMEGRKMCKGDKGINRKFNELTKSDKYEACWRIMEILEKDPRKSLKEIREYLNLSIDEFRDRLVFIRDHYTLRGVFETIK